MLSPDAVQSFPRSYSSSFTGSANSRSPAGVAFRTSSRGTVMAPRQGRVGTFRAYCQLLIQPMNSFRLSGALDQVAPAVLSHPQSSQRAVPDGASLTNVFPSKSPMKYRV